MRIADKMAFEQVRSNVSKNRTDMSELQNQAATQKRLIKPSIDPVAAARVLSTRTEINGNTQFIKSIQQARSFLEYSEQSLSELTDILNRAKELSISQSSDASGSASTREVASTEVAQLFSQTVQLGNRKLGDRFIFGGFATTKPPFDPQGNYKGDDGEMKISINRDAHVAMNMPGSKVFLGHKVETPRTAGPDENEQNKLPAGLEPIQPEFDHDPKAAAELRAPSSVPAAALRDAQGNEVWSTKGTNVFKVLAGLEVSLKSNDKVGVQEAMDQIDSAMDQVIIARAQLGSRVNTLNSTNEAHQKGQVDAKAVASQLEDVDSFEVVSDISKTESTLKATLETSGKLIQPSLLDFIK